MECFLCKTYNLQKKKEKIKAFSENMLLLCKKNLNARKHFNHKYSDVVLPENWGNAEIGYHSSCYKEFRVKPKYTNFVSTESNSGHVDVSISLPCTSMDINMSPSVSREIESADSSSTTLDVNRSSSPNSLVDISMDIENADSKLENEKAASYFSEESNATINCKKCFFCNKIRIQHKRRQMFCREIKSKNRFLEKVKKYATDLCDVDMMDKINEEISSIDDTLNYHTCCRLNYFSNFQRKVNRTPCGDWAARRDLHKVAREKIINYIKKEIIENKRIMSLDHIKNCFSEFLSEMYEIANLDATVFSTRALKDCIKSQLNHEIVFVDICNQPFLMSAEINIETIGDEEIQNIFFEQEAQDFALKYRANILKIKRRVLPDLIDSETLDQGECEIPNWLSRFWSTVLEGVHKKNSNFVQRLSASFSQDSIYSVTRGSIKPRKHILLGIAIKSLTGSRKVVNMLSRQGHCLNYSNIQELETSAAYSCSSDNLLCPSNIEPTSILPCGVAWDNFDRYVETSSGKNTLHDTVGIIYQNIPTEEELNIIKINDVRTENQQSANVRSLTGRRKRSYETHELENISYAKQSRPEFFNSSVEIPVDPEKLQHFRQTYFAWVLSHKFKIANTPAWVGYNAKLFRDDSTTQKVAYLTQINNSPTDPCVVKETMRRSMQIAIECEKKFLSVTYDLAMAKIALRIQSAEPEFEKLFINFGSFHIMLSYFKALGKFISGSGLPNILVDSEIVASGSVNSILSGKHFNRCKKIHPLLSLALQTLHFESFLKLRDQSMHSIKEYLEAFNENLELPCSNENFQTLLDEYEKYKSETLQGLHGKTPQVYLMYTRLVEYYVMLDYSIRTGDFDMFVHILPKITNIFFSMNHQNYARYMSIYYDKLINIESTHPGLLEDCKTSFLGVRRTPKPFSRIPVDLTLEQTINADAASSASGVINITNSFSARQKWSITHAFRTSIITKVIKSCDMESTDDITKDLKKSTIERHSSNLDALLQSIKQYSNPFSLELSEDHLYNISKGQSVSNEIYEFLSSIESMGESQRIRFVDENRANPDRFDKVIKKNKIINFDQKNIKKVKINGKMKEIKMQRDVFGRLLYALLQKRIDLERALCYPLAPISCAFTHTNGTICKTPKSVVLSELIEDEDVTIYPPEAGIHLFDGFYFLHSLKNVPDKYGKLSEYILKILTHNKKEVHIIFDKYKKPSLKDFEHELRGEDDSTFDIRRESKRPSDFCKLLRSSHFKEKFVEFLINDWAREELAYLIAGKTIKLNYDKCYVFEPSLDGKTNRTIDYNLSCYHEEADTKIVYHICQLNKNYRVQVHCTDTDIPIIMLANFKNIKQNVEIDINLSTGRKSCFININKIYEKLGEQLASALTLCHIFTGNDFNPSFYGKGKKKPFRILRKNNKFQEAFLKLMQNEHHNITTSSEVFKSIEEFVCRIYNLKTNNVNKGRYEIFERKYKYKNISEEVAKKKIVGYDPSCLPPTKEELLQHIKRTIYISSIWCNAHLRSPTEKAAENYGWTIIDNKYEFYWFDGPHSPSFEDILSSDFQDADITYDDDEDEITAEDDVSSEESEFESEEE